MKELRTSQWHIRERIVLEDKPERLKNVQVQYMNGATYQSMKILNMLLALLDKIETSMEKRIRSVPKAWWKFKTAKSFLTDVAADLQYTIPQEKLDSLNADIKRSHFEIRQGSAVTYQNNTDSVIPTKKMIALSYYAWQGYCKICCKQSCNGCKLCDALDYSLIKDRKGLRWNQVDITEPD